MITRDIQLLLLTSSGKDTLGNVPQLPQAKKPKATAKENQKERQKERKEKAKNLAKEQIRAKARPTKERAKVRAKREDRHRVTRRHGLGPVLLGLGPRARDRRLQGRLPVTCPHEMPNQANEFAFTIKLDNAGRAPNASSRMYT